MYLTGLTLENFRNYQSAQLAFSPGVNLIIGDNAQGKTNLLEAIGYLGSGKSFRAQRTAELICFGASYANVEGTVISQEREQKIRYVLFPGARPRAIYRNGVKKKSAGDINGVLPTVLFCPEDLMMLKAGAAQRRRFGDYALCQLRPNYDAALTEYNRILEQKSRILKDHFDHPSILEILPEFDTRLCQVGALLISYRARFYRAMEEAASKYHSQFSGGAEAFRLEYKTVSTVDDSLAPIPKLTEKLMEHLQRHRQAELETGLCLTGPHKDDFTVTLNGVDLKAYGSQGQVRTSAISLKLAQRELMAREFKEEPVLLLDDVLSELDPGRQDFILNKIVSGQVFITCCEPGRFTELGKTIEIQNGSVK